MAGAAGDSALYTSQSSHSASSSANQPPPPYTPLYGTYQAHNSENSPLLSITIQPRKPTRRRSLPSWCFTATLNVLVATFAIVFVLQNVGYLLTLDDVPAGQKRALRRQWRLEEATRADEAAAWEGERAAHAAETAEWAREREEWAAARREEERRRKEVERRREGVHWSEPWHSGRGTCRAYGTRAYSAHLLDIPEGLDWYEVCSDMPIKFHGRWVDKPDWCQRGGHGEVWATWLIGFGEPECNFHWDQFRDLGCINGYRHYEATLKNLHHGDDWDTMCETTPATVHGIHFEHPTVCEDRNGRTGIWRLPEPCSSWPW